MPDDIYQYPEPFPRDTLLMRTRDGHLETYVRLVGVERLIKRTKMGDGGFTLGGRADDAELLRLRRARSDLGAHYARIFQRPGRPPEPPKETEPEAAEVTP